MAGRLAVAGRVECGDRLTNGVFRRALRYPPPAGSASARPSIGHPSRRGTDRWTCGQQAPPEQERGGELRLSRRKKTAKGTGGRRGGRTAGHTSICGRVEERG